MLGLTTATSTAFDLGEQCLDLLQARGLCQVPVEAEAIPIDACLRWRHLDSIRVAS
jgi:hypothetical protein